MRQSVLIGIVAVCSVAFAQESKENADFKLAVSLYNDKLYDLALEQFRQFVSSYPNTRQGVEARFYLGLAQSALGHHDEARFTFQNFALAFPDHPKAPDAWWNTAEAFARLNNAPEAAQAYERVKTFHPKSPLAPAALLKAGEYFNKAGDRGSERRVLRSLTQEYAASDVIQDARFRLALINFADGQFESAAAEARRSADASPATPLAAAALHLNAKALAELGRTGEARRVLNDIVGRFKGKEAAFEATLELGRIQIAEGNTDEALRTWGTLLDAKVAVSPRIRQSAFLETGEALSNRGKISESLTYYEQASALQAPRKSEAYYRAFLASERLGNLTKAGEYALKAVDADSGTAYSKPILLGGFRGAVFLNEIRQAVRLSERFRLLFPRDHHIPRLLLQTAELLAGELRDTRQAINLYEEILTNHAGDPSEDDALMGYARALRRSGSAPEALTLLESLRKRFPASDLVDDAEEESFQITTFEQKDKEGGLENIALLTGDVIAGRPRGELAFRLGEIYFNDLKDYKNAAGQYLNALKSGLPRDMQAEAWFRRGRSLELAEYGKRLSRESLAAIVAAYDSSMRLAPGSDGAGESFTARARLLIRSASSVNDLRQSSEEMRKGPGGVISHELLLSLAEAYQRMRAFNDARSVFEEVLRTRPTAEAGGRALYRLAMTRFEMGEADSGATLLASYVSRYPSHRFTAKALVRLARVEAQRGEYEKVLELTGRLEKQFGYTEESGRVDEVRGDAYYVAGSVGPALAHFKKAHEACVSELLTPTPVPSDLLMKLADCSRRTSAPAEAKRFYAQVLARDTSSAVRSQILFALAGMAREENNLEAAAGYLQEASKFGSADPARRFEAALESANLLFQNEDFAGALARYTELLGQTQADSLQRLLQSRIVVCYFRLENPVEAEKRATAFVRSFPRARSEAAEFEYERGRQHLRREETELAIRRFENVRERYPQAHVVPEAVYWLARSMEMNNQPQRAVQLYDSLLKAFPRHPLRPRIVLSLGNVYYHLEQWDAAAQQYKMVVDEGQASSDITRFAMSNLIMAYKEIGLFDAALQLTRQYIDRYPNDPDLIVKRIDIGVLYQKLGYYDQSILHLQTMLESADPELEGELRYYLGETYFLKGEYQQAILEFLKVPYLITARTKVDWIATSYYMAGQSYEKMSKFDQAITMYKQIIDRPGIDPTFKSAAQKEIDRVNLLVKANPR